MNLLYFSSTDFFRRPNPSFHLMCGLIDRMLDEGDTIYYVGVASAECQEHIPAKYLGHPRFHYRLLERKPVDKKNLPKRYLSGIGYALSAAKYIKEFMPLCDVAYVTSSPTSLYNIKIVRKYAGKKKVVMNVQDMFPGSSIASGVMPRKWMQRIFYWLQKKAYRTADVIVGISEDMRDKIIAQGVPREKTEVILNWFDDKHIRYVDWESNRFVKKLGMSRRKFYVQYAGTMGFVFDYKMVIEVAKRLLPYENIEIQMIGMGSRKDDFIRAATDANLTNIKFLPLEPVDMVPDVYSACSVCFIPLKHGIIGNSVPSKAGLLMKCYKPIVTSADEGCKYAEEINSNHLGIACPDDDPDAVAEAILYLYKNPHEVERMGKNGFSFGHELYSSTYNTGLYHSLFHQLANK